MAGGSDPADLLQRHVPVLRYDSQEPYFADATSEWTDNPGNQLRRAVGTVIAAATAVAEEPLLSLSFLDPVGYPNGEAVSRDDRTAVLGAGLPGGGKHHGSATARRPRHRDRRSRRARHVIAPNVPPQDTGRLS